MICTAESLQQFRLSIEKVVFRSTWKFYLQLLLQVFTLVIFCLLYVALTHHNFLVNAEARHRFEKLSISILAGIEAEILILILFVDVLMSKGRKKLIQWLLKQLEKDCLKFEQVTVKKVPLIMRMSGRFVRLAIMQGGQKINIECCLDSNLEFEGIMILIPKEIRSTFYHRDIAIPAYLISLD